MTLDQDINEAQALRCGPVLVLTPPVRFATHPNAPAVVNRFVIRGGRRVHNVSPWFAKYCPDDSAEWMVRTMNRFSHATTVFYLCKT
jgi:hypothetical protein